MSKYNLMMLWEKIFPHQNEVCDYAGRRMLKSAIGNQNSRYCPTIDKTIIKWWKRCFGKHCNLQSRNQ